MNQNQYKLIVNRYCFEKEKVLKVRAKGTKLFEQPKYSNSNDDFSRNVSNNHTVAFISECILFY